MFLFTSKDTYLVYDVILTNPKYVTSLSLIIIRRTFKKNITFFSGNKIIQKVNKVEDQNELVTSESI